MRCLALGFRQDDKSKIKWVIPGLGYYLFFNINSGIQTYENELKEICNNMQDYECQFATGTGYYLGALKTPRGCCLVATDSPLTKGQMARLANWVINKEIPLDTIADNFNTYITDQKIEQIQKNLEETKEVVRNNLDRVLEREEDLNVTIKRSEDLKIETIKFVKGAEDLNSCWGRCTIF